MNERIMVVDDEDPMRKVLKKALELEGYIVTPVPGGQEALDLLEDEDPDLVILDIKMPGLNGFQVLDEIRKRSDIPVIMLSGLGEVTNIRDALSAGADDFLKKPFHMSELLARIKVKLRLNRRSK